MHGRTSLGLITSTNHTRNSFERIIKMEDKEIFERLKKLIAQSMPDVKMDDVTPETRLLEDLKFDSLGMMMLAMAMEDEFGISFDEPVNFATVKDVLEFVKARQ